MKAASIKQIKEALESSSHADVVQLCLKLLKYKKENKELASYHLFYADSEHEYIADVKDLLTMMFTEVNTKNAYFAKKNIRKIVRTCSKYIKYSTEKTTGIELLIFVCKQIKTLPESLYKNIQILNIHSAQVKKIKILTAAIHEDLQYDFEQQIKSL